MNILYGRCCLLPPQKSSNKSLEEISGRYHRLGRRERGGERSTLLRGEEEDACLLRGSGEEGSLSMPPPLTYSLCAFNRRLLIYALILPPFSSML